MRLRLKDFGPIVEADLLIRPLTVLTGPNAAGKSYVAYALWCLLSVEPNWWMLREIIESELNRGLETGTSDAIALAIKDSLLSSIRAISSVFKDNLEGLLQDTFQVDNVGELVRKGSSSASIKVCNDDCSTQLLFKLSGEGLEIVGCEELAEALSDKLSIEVSIIDENLLVEVYLDGELLRKFKTAKDDLVGQVAATIPSIMVRIFDGFYMYADCVVLPDGRAGLLRTVQALSHVLLTTRERVFVNAVDAAFIRSFQALSPRIANREIANLAEFFEEKIGVVFSVSREPPRFRVAVRGIELPIERAPSGLREIAPLICILKHALRRGSFLIVEEPEAHLHPDAQALITRVLAGLANHGVTVITTTHSLHVIDELSNLLRLSSLSPEEKLKLGYEEWEGLSPEDLGVYHVDTSGIVSEVEAAEEGLDETGLDRVVSDLAGIHAAVERYYRSRGT